MRKSLFGKFFSPYMENGRSTVDDCYRVYKQDSLKKVEMDGRIYSKIISCCRFYGYEDFSYHIIWEPYAEIRRDDVLIDENGNEFKVRSLEMIRFIGEIPEWYFRAPPIVITGDGCAIGCYLAKK